MNLKINKGSALIYSIISYFIIVAGEYFLTIEKLGGSYTYSLDDAYTHMAIAKNAALHSVWGVTQYNFSSSTSAPLWTFILAVLFKLFGVYSIIPLILNIIIGLSIIISAYKILARYVKDGTTLLVLLLALIIVVPIPLLAFIGMESLLHILFVSLFIQYLIPAFNEENKKSFYLLLIIASLVCMVRYESYFMILATSLIFLYEKKIIKAFLLLVSGWVLISIYGFWSMSHGWYFFPNTLLVKGNLPSLTISGIVSFLQVVFSKMSNFSHIYGLLFITALFILKGLYSKDTQLNFVSKFNYIILVTLTIHVSTAYVAPYYRYEAYLVFLGIIGMVLNLSQMESKLRPLLLKSSKLEYSLTIVLLIIMLSPFIYRGVGGVLSSVPGSKNIHDQQCQMAFFINKYYQNNIVAINDIGAISFYTDAHIIDLVGLSDLDVLRLIRNNKFKTTEIETLTKRKNFDIAVIYDTWFDNPMVGGIPKSWVKCGSWMVSSIRSIPNAKVTFYASDSTRAKCLVNNLKEFNKTDLPKDIAYSVY